MLPGAEYIILCLFFYQLFSCKEKPIGLTSASVAASDPQIASFQCWILREGSESNPINISRPLPAPETPSLSESRLLVTALDAALCSGLMTAWLNVLPTIQDSWMPINIFPV